MKPNRSFLLLQCIAAALVAAMAVGCASLRNSNDAIIRVNASQNPAKARRLTLAGVQALEHHDVVRASDKFNEAIAADQAYGPAHNNLGLLHYNQGDLYQAVLSFEQAMDFMPNDPTVYYNLGLALESAGRTFEAMDLYTQAVEMDPSNPNYLGNLVRMRVRMGEDDPILITQLQDLILIETRPEWRRWADQQLALYFNPALDRGPPTPEFNPGADKDRSAQDDSKDNVIDLTPPRQGAGSERSSRRPRADFDPQPDMLLRPSVEKVPLPAAEDVFNTLPPLNVDEAPKASIEPDYFQ